MKLAWLFAIILCILVFGCISAGVSRQDLCGKIQDSDTKNSCLGIVNKDAAACGMISNPENSQRKDACYRFVAMETQNPSVCSKVFGVDGRQYCLAIAGNDSSKCNEDLGLGYQYVMDACKRRYSLYSSNPSGISFGVNDQYCKDHGLSDDDCYFFKAVDGLAKPYH